ncbi:MAG: c-type cytochrome [Acidobacteria bacterium]|nr:c-type cytochrome [Acidobacteriota bacterium]
MADDLKIKRFSLGNWLSRETEFPSIANRLLDEPASGLSAWSRTTSGMIVLLLFLQAATGILLAFHYVPAVGSAYTTVAFIELAVRDGSWIRSLHYHSSVLLPIVLAAHLLQMIARKAYATNRTAWIFGLAMLVLVLAAAATGFALPWDARAVNGVNIASSLAANTPIMGETLSAWLINGTRISTLTLSRFYGLHAGIVPMLILLSVIAREFIFGKAEDGRDHDKMTAWAKQQFVRNAIAIGLVFLFLSFFSAFYPAPFGPQLADTATYLPRPGPQFLWLFEMQKYTDGPIAAMLAVGFPGLIIGGLIALPLFLKNKAGSLRVATAAVFLAGFGIVGALTAFAIYQDKSDSRISEQLAKQEFDEAEFRGSSFEPQIQHVEPAPAKLEPSSESSDVSIQAVSFESPPSVPASYATNCAKCHGANGEGTKKFPELVGLTTREEDQLTPELILQIINDPKSVGRSTQMPAYRNKLSELEKQQIVSWIRSLSPQPNSEKQSPVQTARVEKE